MKFHLPLSPMQQDYYGSLVDTILQYYPIGIKSDSPEYYDYPGQIRLGEIVVDNIHNAKNFKSRWKEFEKEIRVESKKRIYGETYASRPSFSSSLILKRNVFGELVHLKTLHFSVSLIGPFFTIFGVDETGIKDERDGHDLLYSNKNIVTVSPYKEFEQCFNFIINKIEQRYQGYKFIPFRLHSMLIDGVYDMLSDKECSIYEALFDDCLSGYDTIRMRGDTRYGYEEWIKD